MSTKYTNLEQPGGWANVQIYTTDEITTSPEILTNSNVKDVVITPIDETLDILPVAENIAITEPLVVNNSGPYYNIKAEFEFNIQLEALDTVFNNSLPKKVVLIAVKHFGQQKMYGSKKCPLDFSYTQINGKSQEDGNSIKIKVSGKIPQKPVYITD